MFPYHIMWIGTRMKNIYCLYQKREIMTAAWWGNIINSYIIQKSIKMQHYLLLCLSVSVTTRINLPYELLWIGSRSFSFCAMVIIFIFNHFADLNFELLMAFCKNITWQCLKIDALYMIWLRRNTFTFGA